MLAYLTRGNHFRIGLAYCLYMYTFKLFILHINLSQKKLLIVFPFYSTVLNILIQVKKNSYARLHMQ